MSCELDALRAEIVASAHVDDTGNPIPDLHEWDLVNQDPYYCGNCGTDFDTWSEAIEHIKQTKEVI